MKLLHHAIHHYSNSRKIFTNRETQWRAIFPNLAPPSSPCKLKGVKKWVKGRPEYCQDSGGFGCVMYQHLIASYLALSRY